MCESVKSSMPDSPRCQRACKAASLSDTVKQERLITQEKMPSERKRQDSGREQILQILFVAVTRIFLPRQSYSAGDFMFL